MSVETRVCCDKCLALIVQDRVLMEVTTGSIRVGRPLIIDLCPDCWDKFVSWLAVKIPEGVGP